ncbi:MAG: hypothetical protein AAB502_11475 [Chloroflexota bacterium]
MQTPVSGQVSSARPVHGGLRDTEARALGLDPAQVLDFSASVNPLGPSPLVREALARLDPSAYPDPECRALRDALTRLHGVAADCVLLFALGKLEAYPVDRHIRRETLGNVRQYSRGTGNGGRPPMMLLMRGRESISGSTRATPSSTCSTGGEKGESRTACTLIGRALLTFG